MSPPRVYSQKLCGTCGYDLTSLRVARCPECGGNTAKRELRQRLRWYEWAAVIPLALQHLGLAAYFTINPSSISAFGMGVPATTIVFGILFALAAASALCAFPKPRGIVTRVVLVSTLLFSGLLALLMAYMIGHVMLGIGELWTALLIGVMLLFNASATMTTIHRLLHRAYLHSMITGSDNASLGILGSGQLGRMLAQAGLPLGVRCRFLDATGDRHVPATALGTVIGDGFDDPDARARFAQGLEAVTYEFENVPVSAARSIAQTLPVHPSPRSLEIAQDRLNERELFARVGIDAPKHAAVETLGELKRALEDGFPLPAILKTRRLGYDGKGQARLKTPDDAERAWAGIAAHGKPGETGADVRVPAILDEMIPFERELSIVAVRSRSGEVRCYPPFENAHADGILRRSISPAPDVPDARLAEMTAAAGRVAEDLGHVGVLAVEFFETAGTPGRLLANEIAPRVHNTGHGTIEGSETSQFENHLRAVLGMPLGSTAPRGFSAMLNILGDWPDRDALLAIEGLRLHDYEKAPKPNRKIGHVTITAGARETLMARVAETERTIGAV